MDYFEIKRISPLAEIRMAINRNAIDTSIGDLKWHWAIFTSKKF